MIPFLCALIFTCSPPKPQPEPTWRKVISPKSSELFYHTNDSGNYVVYGQDGHLTDSAGEVGAARLQMDLREEFLRSDIICESSISFVHNVSTDSQKHYIKEVECNND